MYNQKWTKNFESNKRGKNPLCTKREAAYYKGRIQRQRDNRTADGKKRIRFWGTIKKKPPCSNREFSGYKKRAGAFDAGSGFARTKAPSSGRRRWQPPVCGRHKAPQNQSD